MSRNPRNLFGILVILLIIVALPIVLFLTKQQQDIRPRALSTGGTITVCPSGTAGQNGCNYIGGDGIQQAINNAPTGTASDQATIIIKAGNYTRQTFESVMNVYPNNASTQYNQKFFLDSKQKNLILKGEDNTVIDGANSASMGGIYVKSGVIDIQNITFRQMQGEPADVLCPHNTDVCSMGYAIMIMESSTANIIHTTADGNVTGLYIDGSPKVTVEGSNFTHNWLGISIYNGDSISLTNNLIIGNLSDGIFFQGSPKISIINNTLQANQNFGIYIQSTNGSNPALNIKNNLITGSTHTVDYTGQGIAYYVDNEAYKSDDSFTYDFLYRNTGGCPSYAVCSGTGFVNDIDPGYVNWDSDYHLVSNSPARHAGDSSLLNPDGTRSDIGAYGGPGACGLDPNLPGCVTSAACYDLTGDKIVNILDLKQIALQFNAVCIVGTTNYAACHKVDINPDNKIDIFDLKREALQFGTTCP